MAMEYAVYKVIGDLDLCTEFEMLKDELPIIFFGTVGFSPPREGEGRQLLFFSVSLLNPLPLFNLNRVLQGSLPQLRQQGRWGQGITSLDDGRVITCSCEAASRFLLQVKWRVAVTVNV